ncbi:hypothetical protein F5884DRAFT_897663 [Xylogone sp. PMI_703]|nr:hypothetical protein F5884DRAFT_897663 [Xylogone sp. PMI_703]
MTGQANTVLQTVRNSDDDWEYWIFRIKLHARKLDVWQYITPNSDERRPLPWQDFHFLYDEYKDDPRQYKKQMRAMGELRMEIITSVHPENLYCIRDTMDVANMLAILEKRFSPDAIFGVRRFQINSGAMTTDY